MKITGLMASVLLIIVMGTVWGIVFAPEWTEPNQNVTISPLNQVNQKISSFNPELNIQFDDPITFQTFLGPTLN